jgi:hypothetical protein
MRRIRCVAIAAVAVALVFSSVPAAFARQRHARQWSPPPFRITRPRLASDRVVMGVSFEATGLVLPAIAPDDASTTVAVEVYGPARHRITPLLDVVPATLAAASDTGTVYDATLTLPDPGEFLLVAAVSQNGVVVARSAPREVRVVLPYKVSRPRILSHKVDTGASFEASGVVLPAIAGDDASTTVAVLVLQRSRGRHPVLSQVASFDAVLTGPVGDGTGYSATVTLPTAGKYVLVAVVTRDGAVLGRSCETEMKARDAVVAPPVSSLSIGHHRR